MLPELVSIRPRAVERPSDRRTTLLGVLEGDRPARIDESGLVATDGAPWSLDWWIGADDRWYLPAREATARQVRNGPGPVIETTVRIPSGDARHRAHQVLMGGREVTVVEIHNDSPVPVALAVAIRPYGLDGAPAAPFALGLDDDTITVDGRPAVRLPRPPNESGAAADVDLVDVVTAGGELAWGDGLGGPVGRRGDRNVFLNAVALFPLPHRTSLRFVLTGPDPDPLAAPVPVPRPDEVPDAETVTRGWTSMVSAGGRFDFPDPGLTALFGGARARLLLAADELAAGAPAVAPGAGRALTALARCGHRHETAAVVAALTERFPRTRRADPAEMADLIEALAAAALLVDGEHGGVADPAAEIMETAVHLMRGVDKGGDAAHRTRAAIALSRLARQGGDVTGAEHLSSLAAATGGFASTDGASSDAPGPADLDALADGAGATGAWGDDDEIDGAARFLLAARRALVDDEGSDLLLAPGHQAAWRGGPLEVHDAPTAWGRLSYGIRWHGPRPALLWDLRTNGRGPVTLRCPSLDEGWSTTESRGETLLSGSSDPLPAAPGPGDSFS